MKSRSKVSSLMRDVPGVRDADDVPDIAQAELQQLIRHDTRGIAEPEQAVIREDGMQAHRSSVQQAFMAEVAE